MRKNYFKIFLVLTTVALAQVFLNSAWLFGTSENEIVNEYVYASLVTPSNASEDFYNEFPDDTKYIIESKSITPYVAPIKEEKKLIIGPRPYVVSINTTIVEVVEVDEALEASCPDPILANTSDDGIGNCSTVVGIS